MWSAIFVGNRRGEKKVPRLGGAALAVLFLLGWLVGGVAPVGAAGEVGAVAWAGGLGGFLALPVVAGLLFALGILLIIGEFLTAQFTGLGLAGLGLLALIFWGQRLNGAAGWWGFALLALGVALLALELFVLPGFGVAGVAGLTALLGGLFLIVAGDDGLSRADPVRGLTAVGVALLGFVAGGAAMLWMLPRLAARRGLVLQSTVDHLLPAFALADGGDLEPEPPLQLVGATGEALSDLRPGGFALIDGQRVDVITRGEVIPGGAQVLVIADEGYRRIVRRLEPDERESATL